MNPNISAAARSASVTRQYVYDVRSLKTKDGAPKEGDELKRAQEFAAAWDDAIQESLDDLESEARRRARFGVTRLKFTRGGDPIYLPNTGDEQIQYSEQEYSDSLMQFLLRVHRYGDKHQHELTGKDGAPIAVRHDISALDDESLESEIDKLLARRGSLAGRETALGAIVGGTGSAAQDPPA